MFVHLIDFALQDQSPESIQRHINGWRKSLDMDERIVIRHAVPKEPVVGAGPSTGRKRRNAIRVEIDERPSAHRGCWS